VTRIHLLRPRTRVVAALVAAAVVGVTIAVVGGGSGAAPGGSARKVNANAAQRAKLDKALQARSGGTEPGRSRPLARLPKHGKIGALIELDTASTMTAYRGSAARGRAAASSAAKTQYRQVRTAQSRVTSALPGVAPGARVLYRTHSLVAGVAVFTDVRYFDALKTIPGVRTVYPIVAKKVSNAYAVPLQGAPPVWTSLGDTGQDSTIAVIDTGVDFTHANFGGPGTVAAWEAAHAADAKPADPALYPSAKVVGGFDFVGDHYNADPADPAFDPAPAPDPNPLDCGAHGSHVAGTAAGYGVDAAGHTFAGPYNNDIPFSSMKIGPGMAPRAKLYAYKVFGCEGSTNVVGAAIERAADPNGDGDPSDHVDVINMSLGADFGSPQDADSVASNRAADQGITVVAASGNAGDYFDIGGSPADAAKAIAVANTVDASEITDSVTVTAPAAIAGTYAATRSVAYDYATKPDLSGTLAALSDPNNKDGCDPLGTADAAAVRGKVAFLEWTDRDAVRRCGSVVRSGNVAAAGAVGFVFANDKNFFSAGITGSATIPGVMVVKSAGDAIRAQLGAGVVVSGTAAGGFHLLDPANNDQVNGSSSRGVRYAGNVKPDVAAVGTSVTSTSMGTGNDGVSFSGTSMATPMVAGLAALVRTRHPDWTPEEVKADIMNTAGQDLYTGDSHTGSIYAPNRVGSGRIQADRALANDTLAYVATDPGAVSVSFGPVQVSGPTTLTKTVKVANKGLSRVQYDASYQAVTSVNGVSYSVSPASLTVDPRSTRTVTVTLSIPDPAALNKPLDPTMDRVQAGLPREFLADASGRLTLVPPAASGRPTLRVPVYSAPRPASTLTQATSVLMTGGTIQQASLPVSGALLNQGAGTENITSVMGGFELQVTSGLSPQCSANRVQSCVNLPEERSADLKNVGATSDAPLVSQAGGNPMTDALVFFAINTHGAWSTPASKQVFVIDIDTNGDKTPDAFLFNTTLAGQDVFVSELDDASGNVLDLELINARAGDLDTALYDSDTIVLPVLLGALPGVSAAHPRISYGVETYTAFSDNAIDSVGVNPDTGLLTTPISLDIFRPGLLVSNVGGGPLLFPADGTPVVRRDVPAYRVDKGLGAMIVHFQNRLGAKTQVVNLQARSTVQLTLSKTRVAYGGRVDARVTVPNSGGPVPTGQVWVNKAGAAPVLVRGTLNGSGVLAVRLPNLPRGTYRISAAYGGDTHYTAGTSNQVTLVVF